MNKDGNIYDKGFCKLVKVVGNVMGNFYFYGDLLIYEVLVWLSQDWKLWEFLIEMYGNNGLMDGDLVVVMCYIEVCLLKIVGWMFEDIDKDIVEMILNFDDIEKELVVLFVWIFNFFVNGVIGIFVGYVIEIFIYNLGELIDVLIYLLVYLVVSFDDLMKFVFGLDFLIGVII